MAELKTKKTEESVDAFLDTVQSENKRSECKEIQKLMEQLSGAPGKMWGSSIVGFGDYKYTYSTGRSGDWFELGFSPRKQNITLYIIAGFERFPALMAKLGKYKTGSSCLYINKLADIDIDVLKELCVAGIAYLRDPNNKPHQ